MPQTAGKYYKLLFKSRQCAAQSNTVDWEISPLKFFCQLLGQRKLNAENFLHARLIFATWPHGENKMRKHFLREKKAM